MKTWIYVLNLVWSPIFFPLHLHVQLLLEAIPTTDPNLLIIKTAVLCSRPSNSHVTKKEKVHELPKAGSQANTWVELRRRTYTVFWLDVVFSCGGHFFLLMHFFSILWVNVVGKFKVKAYASLHNDLYLKHSHTWDMSQVIPHAAKEDNGATQRVTFLKQKQSNTSRLEGWRLLLEVLSELSLFFFFLVFWHWRPCDNKVLH